jgi:hypothetical protein
MGKLGLNHVYKTVRDHEMRLNFGLNQWRGAARVLCDDGYSTQLKEGSSQQQVCDPGRVEGLSFVWAWNGVKNDKTRATARVPSVEDHDNFISRLCQESLQYFLQ